MQNRRPGKTALAGLSFEVADLAELQTWASSYGLWMVIELDHIGTDGEYEEIVVIRETDSSPRLWHLWRSPDDVVVQPLIGRCSRFGSVQAAIEAMSRSYLCGENRPTRAVQDRPDRQRRFTKPSRTAWRGRRRTDERT